MAKEDVRSRFDDASDLIVRNEKGEVVLRGEELEKEQEYEAKLSKREGAE